MLIKPNRAILQCAIEFYGKPNQIIKANEEMAELTKELCKAISYEAYHLELNKKPIAEELADVLIMAEQIAIMFDIDKETNQFIEYKQSRLLSRVADEKRKLNTLDAWEENL